MEKELPEKYETSKIVLREFGGFVFGWRKEVFIEFLTDSSADLFVVLGGDVLKFDTQSKKYVYTYDNWSVSKRLLGESFEAYSKRSRETALKYLQNYTADEDTVFSPTVTSEVTAGL